MNNFKAFLIIPIFALMIGCGGGSQESQEAVEEPKPATETVEEDTAAVAPGDTMMEEMEQPSQEQE